METSCFLFFATETTGLPKYKASISNPDNWPRMIRLSYIVSDKNGKVVIGPLSHLVRPDGFSIPAQATAINGITTEQAKRDGIELQHVLGEFSDLVDMCSYLVAHNIEFHRNVVSCELLRTGRPDTLDDKVLLCTMRSTSSFCKLPNLKWPRLTELHEKLFGEIDDPVPDPCSEVKRMFECFWELRRIGAIDDYIDRKLN